MLTLGNLSFSISWETTIQFPHGLDLDLGAFMLAGDKKIPDAGRFVFYNNRYATEKALFLEEDDRTGQMGETISLDLNRVKPDVEEIILVISVFNGKEKGITFGDTRNAVAILRNIDTNTEICRYVVNTACPNSVGMEFGRLFYRFNRWRFESLGVGYEDGFPYFLDKFAV